MPTQKPTPSVPRAIVGTHSSVRSAHQTQDHLHFTAEPPGFPALWPNAGQAEGPAVLLSGTPAQIRARVTRTLYEIKPQLMPSGEAIDNADLVHVVDLVMAALGLAG